MAFDAFLKIDTIPGECTDAKHAEWIEILSFSHGVSQTSSGSGSSGGARTAERCDHADFSIVKTLDKASAKLNLACCNGEHIPSVQMELCRATGKKERYMHVVMDKAHVTSVRPGGSSSGGESLPLEEVSFGYNKITWTYTEMDHDTGAIKGDISAFWNLKDNTGG